LLLFACTANTGNDARFVASTRPDRTTFPPVADVLVHRCGSLDCHGQVGRNLLIYGHEGLRFAKTDRPTANGSTTTDEYDEDYLTVVTLEPEIMSAVVAESGAAPDRLTIVRKARGTEQHKGGAIFVIGDPSDLCLTSWLAGNVNTAACSTGAAYRP
jgi:hypothetical protein